MEVDVNNKLEVVPIYNVIGTIYGREEPDRYVLIGNHRDAWVYGAVDASTGTAVTTEIARVLVEMKNSGWRPRRTIKVKKRKLQFSRKHKTRWCYNLGSEGHNLKLNTNFMVSIQESQNSI